MTSELLLADPGRLPHSFKAVQYEMVRDAEKKNFISET